MLSKTGNAILRDLYSGFRDNYLFAYPGTNENDVEQAFLEKVCVALYGNLDKDTRARIRTIV